MASGLLPADLVLLTSYFILHVRSALLSRANSIYVTL